MTTVDSDARPWSVRRWVGFTAAVFAVQLSFIFWLGDRHLPAPRKPNSAPGFQLVGGGSSEWLALIDPTLFALPHAESFSGKVWLETVPPQAPPFEWAEQSRWLQLPVQLLGAAFARLVPTNSLTMWQPVEVPESRPLLPLLSRPTLNPTSSLRLEGDLASRPLLREPKLPAWPPRPVSATETDMLTNTVLQALVDSQGKPVSLTLLSGSGSAAADEMALSIAPGFRFEPMPTPARPGPEGTSRVQTGLSWGRIVFEWQTLGSTNLAPAPP